MPSNAEMTGYELVVHVVHGSISHQTTLLHDAESIRYSASEGQVLFHEQNSKPAFTVELHDEIPNFADNIWLNALSRLIQNGQRGLGNQSSSPSRAPLGI